LLGASGVEQILVAASLEGHGALRKVLRGVGADYVTSFAGGVEALLHREYEQVVIDLRFADARMLEFVRHVKDEQPEARVVCINVVGRALERVALSWINANLRRLGYQPLIDLGEERRRAKADRRAVPRAYERRSEAASASI
jgi:CheY-like chemotaxis protein